MRKDLSLWNLNDANSNIENYFAGDEDGKVILKAIRDNLEAFNERGASHDASLRTSDPRLKAILESLSLRAPEVHPGLGELNLLFIAAELILLNEEGEDEIMK